MHHDPVGLSGHVTRRRVQTGRMHADFEPDTGALRDLRMGGLELVRLIHVCLRDENWNTLPIAICEPNLVETEDAFEIRFAAECISGPVDFAFESVIHGTAAGRVRYEFQGAARSNFLRNRIGLCVLLPQQLAGRPCEALTTTGESIAGHLPQAVAPHQPFLYMRGLAIGGCDGAQIKMRFAGDVFEMEDQRNWTDASFKIYSTPLADRHPVAVATGDSVTQSVDIALSPPRFAQHPGDPAKVQLKLGDDWLKPAAIGLRWPDGGTKGTRCVDWLCSLAPDHLRLSLGGDDSVAGLLTVAESARHAKTSLAVDLALDGQHHEILETVETRIGIDHIESWQLSGAGAACPDAVSFAETRKWLMARGAKRVGIGTQRFFTEFNRERPPTDAADFAFFSVSPQVHAFDNASIMETLSAWPGMLRSAKAVAGGIPLLVGPISLKPELGPFGPATPGFDDRHDWRQSTLFAAAWALGLVAQLAGRVETATLFDSIGRGGVIPHNDDPVTVRDDASSGTVFPVWHIMRELAGAKGCSVRRIIGCDRLGGLAWQTGGDWHVMLANLAPEAQDIALNLPPGPSHVSLRMLDERSLDDALKAPETWRSGAEKRALDDGRLHARLMPFGCLFAGVSQ